MKNEKVFTHVDVLRDGKIRTVDMESEVVDPAVDERCILSFYATRDDEKSVRCSRRSEVDMHDWDCVYCDALASADMKRQKEINLLLDEIQRLRNLVFTLED